MLETGARPPRHQFFLDPDDSAPFPVCIWCDGLAPIRSLILAVSFFSGEPLILDFECRYCDACDMVMIGQDDLEERMAEELMPSRPDLIGEDYGFLGTLDPADWKKHGRRPFSAKWLANHLYAFIAEVEHCFDDEEEPDDAESPAPILFIPRPRPPH